jgi:hypothetical protein
VEPPQPSACASMARACAGAAIAPSSSCSFAASGRKRKFFAQNSAGKPELRGGLRTELRRRGVERCRQDVLTLPPSVRIHLAVEPVDLRRGQEG